MRADGVKQWHICAQGSFILLDYSVVPASGYTFGNTELTLPTSKRRGHRNVYEPIHGYVRWELCVLLGLPGAPGPLHGFVGFSEVNSRTLKSLQFQMLKLIRVLIPDLVHPSHTDLHALLRPRKSEGTLPAIVVTFIVYMLPFIYCFWTPLPCLLLVSHFSFIFPLSPSIYFILLFQPLIFSTYEVHRLVLGRCWGYSSEQDRHNLNMQGAFLVLWEGRLLSSQF